MKLLTPRWRTPLIFLGVLLLIGVLAPAVSAAPGAATADVTPGTVPAGTTGSYTYTLTPTSGQASSFNLTAPTGWTIKSVDSAPSGVQLASGSSTVIQGRGLTITSSSPLTVGFTAQAPCAAADDVAWTTAARTGGNFNGASVSVNPVSASVTGHCTAEFVENRGPADAALNDRPQSEPITSEPYTPSGDPMQVEVRDANGNLRGGISVALDASGGGGSEAVGDTSETTGSDPSDPLTFGIATFDGSVTLANIGQGYVFTPSGAFVGEPSAPFGIYQEGEACATSPCVVHGHNGNNSIRTTVSAGAGGDLGTFVSSDVNVACAGYTPLTGDAIVWKYTGGGSQTIVIDLSKSIIRQIVDRGSDHLDFCFDSEGKPFTDKFGVAHQGNGDNGLLSDCNTGIDPANCIVSQTGLNGGGRRVTVIVADGRGKI